MDLIITKYKFNSGPVSKPSLLTKSMSEGNCRLALQMYFYFLFKLWLPPEKILNPNAYNNIGQFIFKQEPINFDNLKVGDIIYAQKIKNKKMEEVKKDPNNYTAKDEWIVALHTAIYTGAPESEIWHATSIENRSCCWSLNKFLAYYKPISVKRII